MKRFDEIFEKVKKRKKTVVLVGAEDRESLIALDEAIKLGFVDAILVGNGKIVKDTLKDLKIKDDFEIIDSDPLSSSEVGVKIVSSGKADILMKGLVKTSALLKAVLNPEWGLRTGSLLSHLTVVEAKDYDRFIGITDGGMIIRPTLDQKVQIVKNAIAFFKKLEIDTPKVACIAAIEVVNPDMPETLDAAELSVMGKRKQIDEVSELYAALSLLGQKLKDEALVQRYLKEHIEIFGLEHPRTKEIVLAFDKGRALVF